MVQVLGMMELHVLAWGGTAQPECVRQADESAESSRKLYWDAHMEGRGKDSH
jgi:hypothetical protein